MLRIKVWILLGVFAIAGAGCGGTPSSTPGATSSPPSQVWILQPQDGANLVVSKPHLIKFEGASFLGIDQFEVEVSDGHTWQVPPLSSGSGGPQYGTMFYGEVTWTPNALGDFTISVRAANASGSSPWTTVHVTVIDISEKYKATVTPDAIQARSTLIPTEALWRALAKMNANCRAGPGTVYNITGFVPQGYSAEIVGRNEAGTWLNLIHPNGKGTCWASIIAFEVQFDAQLVPVALAPTLPPPSGQNNPDKGKSKGDGEAKPKGCTVTNPLTGRTDCVSPCPAGAVPGSACTP